MPFDGPMPLIPNSTKNEVRIPGILWLRCLDLNRRYGSNPFSLLSALDLHPNQSNVQDNRSLVTPRSFRFHWRADQASEDSPTEASHRRQREAVEGLEVINLDSANHGLVRPSLQPSIYPGAPIRRQCRALGISGQPQEIPRETRCWAEERRPWIAAV